MLNEIRSLLDKGWTLAGIAVASNVSISTIYRWRDEGTTVVNRHGLTEIAKLDLPETWSNYGRPPPGVYYMQPEGSDWVKIGKTQNLAERLKKMQAYQPTLLQVVAWYPHEKESIHHARWRAHRGLGEWFQYHPDMEQKEDVIVT